MTIRKVQYPAVSNAPFVAVAAAVAVFSSFSQPQTKPALYEHPSVVNVPVQAAQTTPVFSQFSRASTLKPLQSAWLNTPAFIPQVYPTFTSFSQPQFQRGNLPDEQPSALFEVAPPFIVTPVFSAFSQPQFGKIALPDEQPSSLFVEIPVTAPFTGFAKFSEFLIAKPNIQVGFQPFVFFPIPVDTHDGGWIKKKKKRKDPLELKLEEERGVRAALELAFYGPEVTYEIPVPKFEPIPQPIDVGDLPQVIASAQHNQYLSSIKQAADDEEDELAMILKDLG